jgi:hypothetical protein
MWGTQIHSRVCRLFPVPYSLPYTSRSSSGSAATAVPRRLASR